MIITLKKPPFWYWIVSVVALVWNGLGVIQYFRQAFNSEGFHDKYSAKQLELIANAPVWAIAAFAVAAFFGFFGSIALLFRKKWAFTSLAISLIGVIVEMVYNFYIVKTVAIYGSSAIIMTLLIITFSITFLAVAKNAITKKWIG